MMKKVNLFIMALLLLTACQSSQQLKPITEETVDFDLNAAMEMVKPKEKMIVDLALKEKVSKQEYREIEPFFTEQFGSRAKDILAMLFINDMDADPDADIYINKNNLYPTVYHEGIEITKAVVYKSEFENEFFNQITLSIKEEYIGNDTQLKGWNREYIFAPNEYDEWELSGFSGTMNFLGEEYSMNYLELKR